MLGGMEGPRQSTAVIGDTENNGVWVAVVSDSLEGGESSTVIYNHCEILKTIYGDKFFFRVVTEEELRPFEYFPWEFQVPPELEINRVTSTGA